MPKTSSHVSSFAKKITAKGDDFTYWFNCQKRCGLGEIARFFIRLFNELAVCCGPLASLRALSRLPLKMTSLVKNLHHAQTSPVARRRKKIVLARINETVNELDNMTYHNALMVVKSSTAAIGPGILVGRLDAQVRQLSILINSLSISNTNSNQLALRYRGINRSFAAVVLFVSVAARELANKAQPRWESF